MAEEGILILYFCQCSSTSSRGYSTGDVVCYCASFSLVAILLLRVLLRFIQALSLVKCLLNSLINVLGINIENWLTLNAVLLICKADFPRLRRLFYNRFCLLLSQSLCVLLYRCHGLANWELFARYPSLEPFFVPWAMCLLLADQILIAFIDWYSLRNGRGNRVRVAYTELSHQWFIEDLSLLLWLLLLGAWMLLYNFLCRRWFLILLFFWCQSFW